MCLTASFLVTGGFKFYFKTHAWSTSMLLLLHFAFMPGMVKMLLKGVVGGCALNGHGNYIDDYRKSWKNHGIVFFSSPEPKAQGELLVWDSCGCPCVRPCVHNFKHEYL